MEIQKTLFEKIIKPSDVVYTDSKISKYIIDYLKPSGKCLEPCLGNGSFYQFLPANSEFCEISLGIDFFDYNKKVDWIITNPPYSIFYEFLVKSFSISENVSFLVPISKVFQRKIIMNLINNYGGIKSMIVFGNGYNINLPFGYPVANFHFQKNYSADTKIILGMK